MYEPISINMDTILCAWKLQKGFKSQTITKPQKHIDLAKNNLACIVAVENDVENGIKVEDEDGE